MSPLVSRSKNNLQPNKSWSLMSPSVTSRASLSPYSLDRFFEEFFGPPLMPSDVMANNSSKIRSTYEDGQVSVVIDALGIDPKDVGVRISKDVLTVSYNNETYQHRLPCQIDKDSVTSYSKFGQIFLSMKSKEIEDVFEIQIE